MTEVSVPRILYTRTEAAQMLRISPSTLTNLVAQRRIGSIKVADRRLFSSHDLQAYISANSEPAAS